MDFLKRKEIWNLIPSTEDHSGLFPCDEHLYNFTQADFKHDIDGPSTPNSVVSPVL